MDTEGLEPSTSTLSESRSNQLSYMSWIVVSVTRSVLALDSLAAVSPPKTARCHLTGYQLTTSGSCGDRTHDLVIKSHLLCHLS